MRGNKRITRRKKGSTNPFPYLNEFAEYIGQAALNKEHALFCCFHCQKEITVEVNDAEPLESHVLNDHPDLREEFEDCVKNRPKESYGDSLEQTIWSKNAQVHSPRPTGRPKQLRINEVWSLNVDVEMDAMSSEPYQAQPGISRLTDQVRRLAKT